MDRSSIWAAAVAPQHGLASAAGRWRRGRRGGRPRGDAAATIIVDGSSTVFRISKAAQEAYSRGQSRGQRRRRQPRHRRRLRPYLQDEVDIVDASRPAKPDEEAKAKAQGIEWTRFLVGYDGITVVVNPKNDFVKSLTSSS